MRVAMLLLLLCAGSAGASDPLQLFFAGYDHPQPDDSAPFVNPTISYDEFAALPMIPGNWSPDASPGIAAFVAKLTNGANESLTMSSSEFTTSFMESAKVKQEYFPGANDLRGATISYFRVERGFDTRLGVRNRRYTVTAYGHLPEPSSGALLLVLCFCFAHVRTVARSRWNSR